MAVNHKVLLGISGSIAAYKTPDLVRLLIKAGCEVKVVITESAKSMVSELSLATVSRNVVVSDIASQAQWNNHVALGLWANVMLVAPGSANTIAKMANGVCDNMLLACYLSARCPVMLAPAMDLDMFEHATTQKNLAILKQNGVSIIGPASGELASGLVGQGRMEEPQIIVEQILRLLKGKQDLTGKHIVVSAGPTREPIDPVRYLSNYSTGKMGYAIAEQAAKRGAQVTLIAGKGGDTFAHKEVKTIWVDSAEEMYKACELEFEKCNAFIMSAAVADYTPETVAAIKIKKKDDEMQIKLKKTTDILATLGEQKKGQTLVGFALETNDEIENARGKLKRKNLDLIILNSMRDAGAGFGTDTNKITVLDKNEKVTHFELKTKKDVANDILDLVAATF
ncbi:MAG: bifunctional phosphopantothenoylcysteine decarboxylase/phosphopantothenate--cysteine ligase CoaBC [Bacteroidetes bacterium]|nr:bifunctional phosphopantothenoylcysteine decarboxylase/phosphopantothenate--cysteine ligase CoaBC [Bacteroidota bacterium]